MKLNKSHNSITNVGIETNAHIAVKNTISKLYIILKGGKVLLNSIQKKIK